MNRKLLLLFLLGVMSLCCFGSAIADLSISERYPGPWRHDFNSGISRALAKNNIRGCGEYKYRPSSTDDSEYLVRCTRDGINWSSYIVWVGIDEVMGPYAPDSSLD
ncbi:hypothetical protein ACFL0Q_07950 [Thermodesulfobacteriota bacterium]